MGLRTMRYRAQMLGAELTIQNRPGGGTAVSCRLPLVENPDEHHEQP